MIYSVLFGWYRYTQFLKTWILKSNETLVIPRKSQPAVGTLWLGLMNVKRCRGCWLTSITLSPFVARKKQFGWHIWSKQGSWKQLKERPWQCLPFLTEEVMGMRMVWVLVFFFFVLLLLIFPLKLWTWMFVLWSLWNVALWLIKNTYMEVR